MLVRVPAEPFNGTMGSLTFIATNRQAFGLKIIQMIASPTV